AKRTKSKAKAADFQSFFMNFSPGGNGDLSSPARTAHTVFHAVRIWQENSLPGDGGSHHNLMLES
ncbi:MAG TPA: hypothetical protein VGR96_04870, partial [Acidobacteriaceae bacterium]|nr:hypothetical protein [Acidobacteriaceae bacterium]